LSVRLCATPREERAALLGNTAVIAVSVGVVLSVLMAAGTTLFGRGDIAYATTACFLSWQAQETTRRFLNADFRHRAAVWGDATSFLVKTVAQTMHHALDQHLSRRCERHTQNNIPLHAKLTRFACVLNGGL
jgi:ABC-type Co2+ transport system permease subunit